MNKFIEKCPNCNSKNLVFHEDTREFTFYSDNKPPSKLIQSMLCAGVDCMKCKYKDEVRI